MDPYLQITEVDGKNKAVIDKKYITEYQKLKLALEESEAKYRELFENAIDAIYTQDLEGRILTMNDAGLKIMGCTREEMIGSNFAEWISPETLRKGQEILEKTMSGEVITKPTKIQIVNKNGETKWVEFTIRLIKKDDKIIGIHGIGRDITEKQLLKNKLNQNNKQFKNFWYLIIGTRGGNTRSLILNSLIERPQNANQLAKALKKDYKTIRHHLDILIENEIVMKDTDNVYPYYSISDTSKNMLKSFDF